MEWEYGLIIKGVKQISNDKVNIVAVYNNAKIDECLSRISALLDTEDMRGIDTILVGDFNARIGQPREMTRPLIEVVMKKSAMQKVKNY